MNNEKRYAVWSYDVYGNEVEGWSINDRSEVGYIDVVDDDDKTITNALVNCGFLKNDVVFGDVIIDDNGSEDILYVNDANDDYPLFELILERQDLNIPTDGEVNEQKWEETEEETEEETDKRFFDYEITQSEFEDFDSTPAYYNLPQKIIINGQSRVLGCGTSDRVTVFKEDDWFYVLSTNFNLDYAAIQRINFSIDAGFEYDDTDIFYLSSIEEIIEGFFELSDSEQLDRLCDFWY